MMGVTQLFLGFMDEEVADILENLITFAGTEGRPVIVIERGNPAVLKQRLFERSTLEYRVDPSQVSVIEIAMNAPASPELSPAVFKHLVSQLDSEQFRMRRWHRAAYAAREVKVQDRLCMLTVTPKTVRNRQPYILVRSPEMGLQPDLTRLYLRAIFKALSNSKYGELEISCFGAGGAAAAGLKPGTVDDVNGSFYVGVEAERDLDELDKAEQEFARDPDATTGVLFYGVVKFAARTPVPATLLPWAIDKKGQRLDFGLFRTQKRYRYDQAVELATRAFCLMAGATPGEVADTSLEALPGDLALKKPDLRRVVAEYDENSINLTASFFIGGDVKAAARGIGIGEVNMEDYHVVRVLNSAATKYAGLQITGARVTRVHCDPPEITPSLKSQFSTWAKSAEYTREQFKAAVQWGIDGCRLDKLPSIANWTLAGVISSPGAAVYACRANCEFRGKVLDPFFSEIASDFLVTVRAKRAFPQTGMTGRVIDQLSEYADDILKDPGGKASTVDKILDAMLAGESYDGQLSPFMGKAGKVRVWLRPKKWADSKGNGNDLVILNLVDWDGPRIDRALYKSTNQVVLQEMAAGRVRR